MKTLKLMLILATVTLVAVSCGPKKETQKTLVLYYSQTGNTKAVAQEIASRLNADMEEIVPVNPYDPDFKATIDRCMKDREEGIVTEIKPVAADIAKYDLIFIGYPVWFGTYAPPIATYLSQVNLSGKKVVPFCTFGSGGLESSLKDFSQQQPEAKIVASYGLRAARLKAMPKEIDQFLKAGGFLKGEYTRLDDFSEQHPVSEEEEAVFVAATDGYPMLHAKATTVATRAIPDGTEYLFAAEDLPREDKPDMPPAGEMKVYVTVANGEAPVFTKVVR